MESLICKTLRGDSVPRPPVWMMRQAGRYLPEYRALKEQYDFLTLCKTPELACEVTIQPIQRFRPDGAIIFADILLPAEAMGFEIAFAPGPQVANALRTSSDLSSLQSREPAKCLNFVFEALRLVKSELQQYGDESGPVALLGFAGAPWTMGCYLVDQGPYKHFHGTQIFAAERPEVFENFLQRIADITVDYLLGQIESGAEAVQLFDSWAGNLSVEDYRRFALPPTQRIIDKIKSRAPVILYANGSSHLLEAMAESGANCISVDWRTDLRSAREMLDDSIALQGNFDPTYLFLPREEVISRTKEMLSSLPDTKSYIANLGHGILQHTPIENAQAFIETIQNG